MSSKHGLHSEHAFHIRTEPSLKFFLRRSLRLARQRRRIQCIPRLLEPEILLDHLLASWLSRKQAIALNIVLMIARRSIKASRKRERAPSLELVGQTVLLGIIRLRTSA